MSSRLHNLIKQSKEIIEDKDDFKFTYEDEIEIDDPITSTSTPISNPNPIKKRIREKQLALQQFLLEDPNIFEIGVDEAGRGPLFGRVYTAAVILPKDDSFDHFKMKDSKRFYSKKQIEETADYIKKNALAWHVSFEDEKTIDKINVLQATQESMHKSILGVKKKYNEIMKNKDITYYLLIDGNYFNPLINLNKNTNKLESMPYSCIEGGDNKFTAIAAASILAKVERDKYIHDLCKEHPELIEKYGIDQNKGYGSKQHLDGIRNHGITVWHRRSFGICSKY
uniref:Ribonuclease HII n=1 Tax=viral metagenome TaxID=1070528 RepID=A0A6C0DKW3_9ZZZZ